MNLNRCLILFLLCGLSLPFMACPLFSQSPSNKPQQQLNRSGAPAKSNSGSSVPANRSGGQSPSRSGSTNQANRSSAPVTNPPPAANKPPTTAGNKNSAASSPATTDKSKPSAAPESKSGYLLRYKLKPGQEIHSEVQHLVKADTKINGTAETLTTRTICQQVWDVTGVSESGEMTFVHRIDSVDMSQQKSNSEEIRFNSITDEEVPPIYRATAERIKNPISTITIDPLGKVVDRADGQANPSGAKNDKPTHKLGMGDIAVPLPPDRIEAGHEWSFTRRVQVQRADGTPKGIEVRELYKLEKVSSGVATISIRSEALTPISEQEIEAQLMQEMSNGTIRFDIDAGHMIAKELKWDQNVIGFSGPGSMTDYAARYTVELKSVREPKSAERPGQVPAQKR